MEHINRAISLVDWENMFLPLDVSEQAKLFNEVPFLIYSAIPYLVKLLNVNSRNLHGCLR